MNIKETTVKIVGEDSKKEYVFNAYVFWSIVGLSTLVCLATCLLIGFYLGGVFFS